MAINPKLQYDFMTASVKREIWEKVIKLSFVLSGQKQQRVTASETLQTLLDTWQESQSKS